MSGYDSLLFLQVALSFFLVRVVEVGKMAVVGLQLDEFELHRRLVESHLINIHLTADSPHCHSLGVTSTHTHHLLANQVKT